MIIPAILEEKFEQIAQKINLIANDCEIVQIDVIDGKISEGKTFLDVTQFSQFETAAKFQLDLIVKNPADYLVEIRNVKSVIANCEAGYNAIDLFIDKAKSLNYQIGLSINIDTPTSDLEKYLDDVDFVQFMGVTPGKQGNEFNPKVLDKIEQFKRMHPSVQTQVDGGVNNDTLAQIIDTKVDHATMGSAIFSDEDPVSRFKKYDLFMEESQRSLRLGKLKIQAIGFLGGAQWTPNDQPYKDAFETAKLLAQNGYGIVNGGGPGVMQASTKGAHAGGGKALAITYYPNKPKLHYEGVDPNNDFDSEVKTLDYFDRTKVMLQTTDMHVVFNGSIGTLSELGMTWISSWIHEPVDKPLVLFGEFWHKYIDFVKKEMLLKHNEQHLLQIVTSPKEVIELIKEFTQ